MKKTVILTACLSNLLTHSMENPDQNKNKFFSIVLYRTTINVSKTPLYDIANKVDQIIVGKHEQQLLTDDIFDIFYQPGIMDLRGNILCKHTDDESDSDDETYKPFQEENRSKLWEKIIEKDTPSTIGVAEPCILSHGWCNDYETKKQIPIPCYKVQRFNKDNPKTESWTFYRDHAILEASKDLILCYEEVLTLGLPIDGTKKSIAFPTLSADVGFPREKAAIIALTTITNFIRNNPNIPNHNAYNRMELLVKKRSEFTAYVEFLKNYWRKPGILILAHTDADHFLFEIPRDIIDYILQLMYPCA